MCPIPNLPLIGKNIIIFSNKTFQVLIFVKIHSTQSNFGKIFNHEKNLKDLRGQNHCKNVGLWHIWPFIMIFMDLKLSYLFFSKIII